MNGKHKPCLILTLTAIVLVASPLATVWADCPGYIVYLGRDPTEEFDSSAIPGSIKNPATSPAQARDICKECPHSAVFEYNATIGYHVFREACKYIPEENGVPLAQSVVTILLGFLALGLLAWGLYARWELKRPQTG